LPQSAYEEWLGRQRVKPTSVKPEVEMPTSSYEVWLSERVKKRVQTQNWGRLASTGPAGRASTQCSSRRGRPKSREW